MTSAKRLPIGKALLIAKERLPGWAWCILNNETFHIPNAKKPTLTLTEVMKIYSFAKIQRIKKKPTMMGASAVYAEAIIKKVNDEGLKMRALGEAYNVLPGWAYAVLSASTPKVDRRAAFVCKGGVLEGDALKVFEEVYLPLIGNPEYDLFEMGMSVGKHDPRVFIALGKPDSDFEYDGKLPHPEALLKYGDRGEVARKAQLIKATLDSTRNPMKEYSCESLKEPKQDSDDLASTERDKKQTIVNISKADEDKQIVTGVVLAPYTVDTQGDVLTPDTIEEAAHKWLGTSRTIGLDHTQKATGAVPVESYLMPYPTREDYRKAMDAEPHDAYKLQLGADTVTSGSWILSTKLGDELWAAFKAGDFEAYSIGGYGERENVDPAIVPTVNYLEG